MAFNVSTCIAGLPSSVSTKNWVQLSIKSKDIAAIEGKDNILDSDEEKLTALVLNPEAITVFPADAISYVNASLPETEKYKILYTMWRTKADAIQFSSMDLTEKKKLLGEDLTGNTSGQYYIIKKSILDKGKISVAEADTYYEAAKAKLAADAPKFLDKELSTVTFTAIDGVNRVTILAKGTVYDVTYGNSSVGYTTKTVKSFDELSKYGFTPTQIQDCKYNAQNIPLISLLADEKGKKIYTALQDLTVEHILRPTQNSFDNLVAAQQSLIEKAVYENKEFFSACLTSFVVALRQINPILGNSVGDLANTKALRREAIVFNPKMYADIFSQRVLVSYLIPKTGTATATEVSLTLK
jgi:hypothetical protein